MRPHIQTLLHNRFLHKNEPFSIVHFVTARCNARCSHCFMDFAPLLDQSEELTLDEIDLLTRKMGNTFYNVNITGGEPFIREDLFEIVERYVANTPVRSAVITTNGWFTDAVRSFVERYARLKTPCRITFSISIDNLEQEHDAGRNLRGLHAHALETYRTAAACNDPRISADIALTVTPENAGSITDIYRSLQQAGVSSVSPILLREEGILHTIPNKQAIKQAYQELTRLTEQAASGTPRGFAYAVHRAKNRITHRILNEIYCHPRFISPCSAGSLFGNISADGIVAPCELLAGSMPLGKLRDNNMDFLKIWENTTAENARSRIRDTKCHCTFECAWTVNILTTPSYWPSLALNTLKELT